MNHHRFLKLVDLIQLNKVEDQRLIGRADEKPETRSLGRYTVALSVECSPMTLSRVYGLIGTISMVPALSRTTTNDDGIIDVVIEFSNPDARKFELLCRKLSQLTETVDCRFTAP